MAQQADYGLDADLKAKQDAKYDPELEADVANWIQKVTGEDKGDMTFGEWLHNGKVLCALANAVKPGIVKKVNTMNAPFKQMENITFFTTAARDLGVPESAMFATPDLYEEKNLGSVATCIFTFGGVVQTTCPEFTGPSLGVPVHAQAKDHAREKKVATQCGGLAGTMEKSQATTGKREVAAGASTATENVKAPPPEGADAVGLDADLKAKEDAKFDHDLEKEVCSWIEAVTGEAKGDQTSAEWLHDGKVLCALANTIKPSIIKKVNTMNAPFKQMENIKFFTDAARELGVNESSMFGTPDLYEAKHMGTFFTSLHMFAGAIQVSCPEYSGPKIGKAVQSQVRDEKRNSGLCVDQYEAMQKTMEVERPKDQGITRGA